MRAESKEQSRLEELIYQDHPIKVTALVYLTEALERERYEECEELIQIASEFGASASRINEAIGWVLGSQS